MTSCLFWFWRVERTRGRSARLIAAFALMTVSGSAQTLNPTYLREMPTPERVKAELKGTDARETALLQIGAFYQLEEVIRTLSGPRSNRNQLTPDEKNLIQAYTDASFLTGQAIEKTLATEEEKRKWRFESPREYRFDCSDRRFGVEGTQLFARFFSENLRAQFAAAIGVEQERHRAYVQAQKDAQARIQRQTGYSGSAKSTGAVPQSGKGEDPMALFDGLFKTVSDAINQSLTQQPSTLATNAPSGPVAPMATAELKQGQAFLKTKEYGRALTHFSKSIEMAPSSAAYTGLGSAYFGLNLYPQAIKAYQQAVQMVPNNADLHLWLAMAYSAHGRNLVSGPSASKDLKSFENSEAETREAIRLKQEPKLLRGSAESHTPQEFRVSRQKPV